MLGLLCRRLFQLRLAGQSSSTPLYFYQISCLKIDSNARNEQSQNVDYLVNSCGLSPESALKASKHVLRDTAKVDSLLTLFKSYGIAQHQISNIIYHNPYVLRFDPDKILKPKIELLCKMGISGPNIAKILSRYANFLTVSLERELIPTVEFLRSFIHTDEKIAITLSRMGPSSRVPEIMAPNIETLRNHGVSDSNISKLIFLQPRLLTWKAERFKEIVIEAKEMGLNPSNTNFFQGIRVLAGVNKPAWEAKMATFRRFGWLQDEIFSLFRKHPTIFGLSEKTIRGKLDFFVSEFNWTVADFGKCPVVLWSSMEKRIVPRCSVLKVLLAKGLMEKERMVAAFWMTDDVFCIRYVLKYLDEQPQLLESYQREMGILEPDIGSDMVSG